MSPSTSRPQDAFKQPKMQVGGGEKSQARRTVLVDVPMFDVPMFDVAGPPPRVKVRRRDFPGPRTIRRVQCAGGEHQAGLIVGTGEHLIWRPHSVHMGGATYPCPVVGQCLCQAPAKQVKGIHTPTCQDPTSEEWAW